MQQTRGDTTWVKTAVVLNRLRLASKLKLGWCLKVTQQLWWNGSKTVPLGSERFRDSSARFGMVPRQFRALWNGSETVPCALEWFRDSSARGGLVPVMAVLTRVLCEVSVCYKV
jgi:hypothetical protein